MPALDTRLDWEAIEAVASGRATTAQTPPTGTVQAGPPDPVADRLETPLSKLTAPLEVASSILGENIFLVADLDKTLLWPMTLDGLGKKKVGAFKSCFWCGVGTWTRYAGLPTCLDCARSWPASLKPDGPRAYLSRLLNNWADMDETTWPEANIKALYDDIMDIFSAFPKDADRWFREWRERHPGAKVS